MRRGERPIRLLTREQATAVRSAALEGDVLAACREPGDVKISGVTRGLHPNPHEQGRCRQCGKPLRFAEQAIAFTTYRQNPSGATLLFADGWLHSITCI